MNNLANYRNVRPDMRTMDLLQWHGAGGVSRIIKWKTGGSATHSGVVARLTINRVLTLHAAYKGCVPWPLSHLLKEYDGKVFWHPVRPEYKQYSAAAFNWMYKRIGTKYDFEGLMQNLFSKISMDATALFCSEYVFMGWKMGCAAKGVECLQWLMDIEKAPVPSDLPGIGIYQKTGIQLV